MAGIAIPLHFEKFPLKTGQAQLDDVVNMLVSIKMLVGGVIAVFLDNTVGGRLRSLLKTPFLGASLSQRGLHFSILSEGNGEKLDDSGYAFPKWFTRYFFPFLIRYSP